MSLIAREKRSFIVAIAGLVLFVLLAYFVMKLAPDWFVEEGVNKDEADARQGARTAGLALLAGAIGVIGAFYTARTFVLNQAGQLTDRFSKAIEQLGHKELAVRLGGIYALERIARDSRRDHPQVIEVLTAYVRERVTRQDEAPLEPGAPDEHDLPPQAYTSPSTPVPRPATDVQAALTVLARRTLAHDNGTTLDLSSTALTGANLSGANLGGADLSQADLSWARLVGADLSEAILDRAQLMQANLTNANLSQAHLDEADLTQADLSAADLSGAQFSWANLRGAKLMEAKFTGADLGRANLSWTDPSGADLRGAKYNLHTTWPTDFDPQAGGARDPDLED